MVRRGLSIISALRRLRRGRLLPPVERTAWLAVALPTALSLAILLGAGPWLQAATVGLLSSDAPTVYGTAWSEGMVDFPTLGEWLIYGAQWPLLAVAATATFAGLYAKRFVGTCALIGFTTFLLLSFFDTFFSLMGLTPGPVNAGTILSNIAANFAGSVFLSCLMGAIFWLFEKVRDHLPPAFVPAGGAAALLLSSLCLSSICYFALAYFYRPLPIEMEAIAKIPIRGNYQPAKGTPKDNGVVPDKFDPKPDRTLGGKADLTVPGEPLVIDWHGPKGDATFDVGIDFFSGCWPPRNIRAMKGAPTPIRRQNVKKLRLTLDKGLNELYVAQDALNDFAVRTKDPLFFGIKEQKGGTEFRYFPGPEAEFLNSTTEAQHLFVSTSFFALDGAIDKPIDRKAKKRVPRAMSILIDGERIDLALKVEHPVEAKTAFDCKALRLPAIAQGKGASIRPKLAGDIVFVGARVSIEPHAPSPSDFLSHDYNVLRVAGNIGWATIEADERKDLAESPVGTAEILMIGEGLSSLIVAGRKIEVGPKNALVAVGEIDGEYDKDANLLLTGEARNLWLNDKRLNPTKWERLAIEVQLFVITTLLAAGLGIARSFGPIIRRFADPAPLLGLGMRPR